MKALKCSFEGCQTKPSTKCRCKNPELFFCEAHLGSHLINFPGTHNFEKLFDDPYLQTKNDVLLYMQAEIKNLEDLKTNLSFEVCSAIISLKKNLENYHNKIDLEIKEIVENMTEIMNTLENNNQNSNLEYLKLISSEAIDHIKANHANSISKTSTEKIILEIYKNLGWRKASEFEEISNKNKNLEAELLEITTNSNQLSQENIKEYEELKKSYEELKTRENKLIENLEIFKQSNEYLEKAFQEMYQKCQDLESKNSQSSNAELQRASSMPNPAQILPGPRLRMPGAFQRFRK